MNGLHGSGKTNTLLTLKWSSKWEEMLLEISRGEAREWEKTIPVLNGKPEFHKQHTVVISNTWIQPLLLWSLPPTVLTNSEKSTAM